MKQKFIYLLRKYKSYASAGYSLYDLTELLHHPWHKHELLLLFTVVAWFVITRIAVFVFIQFGKMLPYVFSKRNCTFVLWLLFISLAVITVSNLACNYIHGVAVELIYFKSIITIVALVIDWKETKEAIKKYRERIEV